VAEVLFHNSLCEAQLGGQGGTHRLLGCLAIFAPHRSLQFGAEA